MSNQEQYQKAGLINVKLGAPATVENVLTAVTELAKYSEAEIHQIVSEGRLSEIFHYEVSEEDLPAPALERWSDVIVQRDSRDESKTST